MEKSHCIFIIIIMVCLASWAQPVNTSDQMKSIEIKLFKASVVNGQVKKGEPIYKIKPRYPISGDFNTGKIEYDRNGLIKDIYYPNNKGEYHLRENYDYNENNQVVKAKMTMLELNDSIVLRISYDSLGRIEKTRWNKHAVPLKGWLNNLFYKYWSKDLTDEDYQRYYLSNNDSLNHTIETEFEDIAPLNNHHFELLDTEGNVLKEKYMYIDTTQLGPLHPKTIDTITIQWEYQYIDNGLLSEEKKSIEKKSLEKGLPPIRSYDKRIITLNYKYIDDNKVKEEIKTVEQMPSKTGFLKIKGSVKTFKRVHDYLDNSKKHMIYTYDDKGDVEYTITEVYSMDEKLVEYTKDWGKRKSIDMYNEKGNHTVHTVYRKNKKISESTAKYTYNEHGDWVECVLFDSQKNDPLYIIAERTIEYYN
ncbi:hypothetical protein [Aestuariivivens sp. NBU2969]|uniref:hypothetical protein n=1 Tax=Aestuariivivens sp. NBU2969 TaxID=2873267 RepID=UPI001CC078CF|nr:hypothetical protein [Aestuariivivens sp. NBU2969]